MPAYLPTKHDNYLFFGRFFQESVPFGWVSLQPASKKQFRRFILSEPYFRFPVSDWVTFPSYLLRTNLGPCDQFIVWRRPDEVLLSVELTSDSFYLEGEYVINAPAVAVRASQNRAVCSNREYDDEYAPLMELVLKLEASASNV